MNANSHFVYPVRVYYEDSDSGGVVYHANYLKYMERARTEWLRARGFYQSRLIERHQLIFAVHSLSIEYIRPALFDQLLQVHTCITKAGRASLTFAQKIYRIASTPEQEKNSLPESLQPAARKQEAEMTLLTDARVKIACLHFQPDSVRHLRPRAMPDTLITHLDCLNKQETP